MTGAELKKIRLTVGMSRPALSQVLFYSIEAIKNWENGKHSIPSGMRDQLIRMEIDVDAILQTPKG